MKIKIPYNCHRECRFHCDTEEEYNWCSLYQKGLEKDEDGYSKKPEWCTAKELGETEEIRKQTAGEIIKMLDDHKFKDDKDEIEYVVNVKFDRAIRAIRKKYLEG